MNAKKEKRARDKGRRQINGYHLFSAAECLTMSVSTCAWYVRANALSMGGAVVCKNDGDYTSCFKTTSSSDQRRCKCSIFNEKVWLTLAWIYIS